MKKLIVLAMVVVCIAFIASCGGNKSTDSNVEVEKSDDVSTYDPNRGEGKFTKIDLGASLNAAMADNGEKVYKVKCGSCHKLTEERLVGPGWAGVSTRHTPEWIMNFTTNPEAMIDKDPKLQAQLELCLVRMPNQNINDDDARNLLEFMRKNDGVK